MGYTTWFEGSFDVTPPLDEKTQKILQNIKDTAEDGNGTGPNNHCDWIYNPKGYEEKTWVIIYNAKDFDTRLWGNYVLWSDKEIRRKRGILNEIKKMEGLKYYSTSVSD